MAVTKQGLPNNNKPFRSQPVPHINERDEFSRALDAQDAEQKRADAKVLRQHKESLANVEKMHQRGFRKSR